MVDAFMGFTSLHLLLDLPKRSCMHFAPLCALHYAPCSISYVTRACVMFCRVLEVNEVNERDMHIPKLPPRLAKPTLQLLLSNGVCDHSLTPSVQCQPQQSLILLA